MNKFIVAEVSKSWPPDADGRPLLCSQFALIVNVNDERGYDLVTFSAHCYTTPEGYSETIIAVFKKKD